MIFQLSILVSPKHHLICCHYLLKHYYPDERGSNPKSINVEKHIFLVGSDVLSISSENDLNWVYRIFDRRTISVKAKNEQVRKIAAIDLVTNLPFGIEVSKDLQIETLEVEKAYYASLKVHTARNITDVAPEQVEFFEVLDVDQPMEEFIKAYWLYPKLIRFELVEVEPL